MNTFSIAVKNLKKDFSFYLLYLISIAFVITVFFSFTSFSVNQVMLEKISNDGRVETMCRTISVFLMVFVIFYMAYSNRFFLRRRTKELGIYALLGYRRASILSMLTFENMIVCCGAFVIGITAGGLAHKGIVYGISELLHLSINHAEIPLFEASAVMKTAFFIFFVVFVLLILNGRFLYQTSLMNLVRYEKSSERKMHFRKVPAILGIVMTAGGYALSLDILRGTKSLWISIGFYPLGLLTLFLVVFGTILFIASFLPYVVRQSKKRRSAFYTSSNIITTPGFIYRIRSNAKTLIMLTLLSAATLTISSVMALTLYYPIAAVSRIAPSEIECPLTRNGQLKDIKQIVNQHTNDAKDVVFTTTELYKIKAASDQLPLEYSLGSSKNGAENEAILREPGFECMSFSSYQALLASQGKTKVLKELGTLSDSECILIKYQADNGENTEAGSVYPLLINDTEIPVTVKKASLDNVISFANSIGTLIVSDELSAQIAQEASPSSVILSINGSAMKDNEKLYSDISEYLNGSPYLQGNSHRINNLLSLNSSTFLLIGFLVVLFFIAAGSILYFNNISAITDSRSDYEILQKIGYTQKQIKKIIRKQIRTFYCIPFLLGLADCVFATLIYKSGLMQNILGNSLMQYVPVIIAIVLTAVIYLVYYILTVRSCCKTIL